MRWQTETVLSYWGQYRRDIADLGGCHGEDFLRKRLNNHLEYLSGSSGWSIEEILQLAVRENLKNILGN